jgi:hypothetical protein
VLNQTQIEFFGMVFDPEGVSPDPHKVEAIKKLDPPGNASEIRSFLGTLNYSSRFIKNYATISEPLRQLTKRVKPWVWGKSQQRSFEDLKNLIQSDIVMAYFDPGKHIEILVDASPVGLDAMLQQDDHPVVYASRSLTDTESRYSQTARGLRSCVGV